ncbi:MAG: hypothetical protein NTV69_06115 [Caldilinea sp.]|jgi:hypothetical protein|nr:hypothetical protein [Caldilinea sp.]
MDKMDKDESGGSFSALFWIALVVGLIGLFGIVAVGVGAMAGAGG